MEATNRTIAIMADLEYGPDEFWNALREHFGGIAEALTRQNWDSITPEEWESIQRLPGFNGGPPYAPTALRTIE